eukprot:363536-Chlamydomonas_euryale.AAC.2
MRRLCETGWMGGRVACVDRHHLHGCGRTSLTRMWTDITYTDVDRHGRGGRAGPGTLKQDERGM